MSQLDDEIKRLQDDAAKLTDIRASIVLAFGRVPEMIKSAVEAALIAGATPGQLAAVSAVADSIESNLTPLSEAVIQNTSVEKPPAPAPEATPTPESDPNAGSGGVGGASS